MQILVFAGAAIFVFLGTLHAALTFKDLRVPRAFAPRDPALLQAMQQSSIRLHTSINLWRAWLGFNLSHSLGLVLFGGAFVYLGLFAPALFAASPLLQAVALLVSAIYLLLSLKFWLSKPVIGSATSLICFLTAILLAHL